ncbi:MAG: sigma factor-like helix-turn-helix DNA-binding protein [Clostridia bacterium]
MHDLLEGYVKTRAQLLLYKGRVLAEAERLDEKKNRYEAQGNVERRMQAVEKMRRDLDVTMRLVGGMISDVEFSIEWMNTGRCPGNKRGIERRAAYERERPVDPVRLQAYASNSTAGSPCNLSETQRERLKEILEVLTDRERECYVLTHGEGFTFSQAAQMLGISKSSIQTNVTRAQAKIVRTLREKQDVFC